MRWKELTDSDKEYLKLYYYDNNYSHNEKMQILSKKFEVKGRTIRRWWREELKLSKNFSTLPSQLNEAREFDIDPDTDILIAAAAQNKTAVNRGLFENIESYASFLRALGYKVQIAIAPARYRNPTSPQEDMSREEWWVDEVKPYLCYNDLDFGDTMLAFTERIRPTAVNPLSGYQYKAHNKSVVFPHSKIHLESLPRFKNQKLRTISTTGFITVKNYSDSKAGSKGSDHHTYGFVVIEKDKDGNCYAPRNVKADSFGNFSDVKYQVIDGEVTEINNLEGMILGDIHNAVLNREFFNRTKDLISALKPKTTVLHDVFDGASINPHEGKDMFIQKKKIKNGASNLGKEIKEAIEVVGEVKQLGTSVKVIQSNHDEFLDRHVNNFDWKKDLHNSEFYLEAAKIQQTVDLELYGNIFGYLLSKNHKDVEYIKHGDSLMIKDYECGLHGEHGTNGSRGNYKSFARLNLKLMMAHTHTPIIYHSVMVVGHTCERNQYYNKKGLSSWQYAHGVVFKTGKNQLWIFNDDYKFTNLI